MAESALNSLMVRDKTGGWYDPLWYSVVESCRDVLQNEANGTPTTVVPIDHVHHKRSFYTWLRDRAKVVEPWRWYPILRANNMTSPADFTSDWTIVIIPSEATLQALYQKYLAMIGASSAY